MSGPSDRRVVTLDQPPSMLPAYLSAVLPGLPVPGRGPRPAEVPPLTLRLAGVQPGEERVAAYAGLVGARPGDRLPLLFPHLLGFGLQVRLMTDPGFPFPALGLVHLANEVVAHRRLPVRAALDVEVHAEGPRPHPRGRVVDLVTEVFLDGRLAWAERSTYRRRAAADGAAPGTASGAGARGGGVPTVPPLTFSARWRLPGDLGRRYGRVSGDLNPIHLHPWPARALGFRRAIAHGMWTAAAVAGAVESRVTDAVRCTVAFRRPILLPATVRLVTAVSREGVLAEVRGQEGDDTVHVAAAFVPLGAR